MTIVRIPTLAFLICLFGGPVFSETLVIDGKSKDTFGQSIKTMVATLPEADREVFQRGLLSLIFSRYAPNMGKGPIKDIPTMQAAVEAANSSLAGVSLDEILAAGRGEGTQGMPPVSTNVDPLAVFRSCLQGKVIVTKARIEKTDYGRNIYIDVTNNLKWAISGIRVDYVATSEGRSVPWAKDSFSLDIPGGIEPGETREVGAGTSFGPSSDAPEQLIVAVTVLDVFDPLSRQLIQDVKVMGPNSVDEKSPLLCE